MNLLKKIFGSKTGSKNDFEFIAITLNDKIQPIDRGEYYEDPLDEYLQKNNIGEVTGGGTLQAESGEIEFVEIEVQLNENVDPRDAAQKVIQFLKCKNAPKNSKLTIEKTKEVMHFGDSEGFGIYLDGQNLDNEVYQNSDVNFVVSEIKKLIGDDSEVVRYWEFPDKTGLYFYGKSFEDMKKKTESFVSEYPLCKNAEIKRIA